MIPIIHLLSNSVKSILICHTVVCVLGFVLDDWTKNKSNNNFSVLYVCVHVEQKSHAQHSQMNLELLKKKSLVFHV